MFIVIADPDTLKPDKDKDSIEEPVKANGSNASTSSTMRTDDNDADDDCAIVDGVDVNELKIASVEPSPSAKSPMKRKLSIEEPLQKRIKEDEDDDLILID